MKRPGSLRRACFFVIAAACACLASQWEWGSAAEEPAVFEITMAVSADSTAQIFFDLGEGYAEANSVAFPVIRDAGAVTYRVDLPKEPWRIERVRFDPLRGAGVVTISSMVIKNRGGQEVARLTHGEVRPFTQIASWQLVDGAGRLQTDDSASDPYCLLNPAPFRGPSGWRGLRTVRGRTVLMIGLGLLLLFVGATHALKQFLARPSEERGRLFLPVNRAVGMALALGGVVLGSRLWLTRVHSLSVYYADSWEEVDGLFLPFAQRWLGWGELLAAHNQHRIAFTRLLDLALVMVNKQWDGYISTVVNAFMPAFCAVLLCLVLWKLAGRNIEAIIAAIALAWALPSAWENTLAGFQSQFYFLILFCVLALWLVLSFRPLTWPWICGMVFAVASLVTVASGILTPAVIVALTVCRLLFQREDRRENVITLMATLAICVFGAWSQPSLAPGSPLLATRATGLADFFFALGVQLSWPNVKTPLVSLVAWIPVVLLLSASLWRRKRFGPVEEMLAGLGLWTVLNAAAIAYGRGGPGGIPDSSRYMDVLSLGMIVNFVSAALLASDAWSSGWRRSFVIAGAIGWMAITAVGLEKLVWEALEGARTRGMLLQRYETNLRRFLATDDPGTIASLPFPEQVPHPYTGNLVHWLRNPWVRQALPASLRSALPVEPDTASGFVRGGAYPATPADPTAPSWGSFGPTGDQGLGRFVSKPVACTQGQYLRFETAGYLGRPGLTLRLESEDGGTKQTVPVVPDVESRESWKPLVLACPASPFRIVAEDASPTSWFAFRPPTETGRLWVWANWLAGRDQAILWSSVFALALLWGRRNVLDPQTSPKSHAGSQGEVPREEPSAESTPANRA